MARRRVASGTPWERLVGYSRAVRSGDFVAVSGTTSTGPDGRFVDGSAYEQTRRAIVNIEHALVRAGAQLADVVRTRIFVRQMADWPEIGRAHAERFGAIRPATTMIEVAGLVDPAMRVEIEADAVVDRPTISHRALRAATRRPRHRRRLSSARNPTKSNRR